VLTRKLAQPAKLKQAKVKRGVSYGADVLTALIHKVGPELHPSCVSVTARNFWQAKPGFG
jgi:hypothetical protein